MLGFKEIQSASATLAGIEVMHMLHKKQAGQMSPRDEGVFISRIMMVG
jgi:hypothetical protein